MVIQNDNIIQHFKWKVIQYNNIFFPPGLQSLGSVNHYVQLFGNLLTHGKLCHFVQIFIVSAFRIITEKWLTFTFNKVVL